MAVVLLPLLGDMKLGISLDHDVTFQNLSSLDCMSLACQMIQDLSPNSSSNPQLGFELAALR